MLERSGRDALDGDIVSTLTIDSAVCATSAAHCPIISLFVSCGRDWGLGGGDQVSAFLMRSAASAMAVNWTFNSLFSSVSEDSLRALMRLSAAPIAYSRASFLVTAVCSCDW